ncbi:hypothetical protein WDU94_009568 [Cyamophila willieti]
MEPSVLQFAFVSTSLASILSVHCAIPLSVRHGFHSVLPLQAPPLGSYRYQFRSSFHHSTRGGFSDSSNETDNPLNEIIMNLHKLESMFFGNNSFFNNFKHKKNRTRLNFPKWFNSWPDFDDDSNSAEGEENTTDDPCGNGSFFDFSDFDAIIKEIKKEIDDFFTDMSSIFPNFHKGKNSTDSSSSEEEEDWFENFFDDIKKSFGKHGKGKDKNGKDNGNDVDLMKMKDNGVKMMMNGEGDKMMMNGEGDKMMMSEEPDTMTMPEDMTMMPEIARDVEELAKVTEHTEKPEDKKEHVEKIEQQPHPT